MTYMVYAQDKKLECVYVYVHTYMCVYTYKYTHWHVKMRKTQFSVPNTSLTPTPVDAAARLMYEKKEYSKSKRIF